MRMLRHILAVRSEEIFISSNHWSFSRSGGTISYLLSLTSTLNLNCFSCFDNYLDIIMYFGDWF